MTGAAQRMLPPTKSPKPTSKSTGVLLTESLLTKLDAIVEEYGVKSRNALIASMLAFDVELFPHIQRLRKKLEALEAETGKSQVQVIVMLLEQSLSKK